MTTTATAEKLLSKLLATPIGKEVVAAELAESLATRQQHVKALADLHKRELAELPKLRAAVEQAKQALATAMQASGQAKADFHRAHVRHLGYVAQSDQTRAAHENALADTAPEIIDETIARLNAEHDRLRHLPAETSEYRSLHVRTLGQRIVETNRPKIVARLQAVGHAMQQAAALKYQVLNEQALATKLAGLWTGLPSTNLSDK